ncbi:hypothetical protein AXX17_AT4G34710 [Arabidopsis thaliana]|uniref:Uncharacterized protein n=1 Tax=Arabidopsis thaliana TaxID=3702 RepID=A0A178V2P7_ARATH|nr:hypothetical protein AXX17_AT4G34710 [Arabidopsis thaliana]
MYYSWTLEYLHHLITTARPIGRKEETRGLEGYYVWNCSTSNSRICLYVSYYGVVTGPWFWNKNNLL